MYRWHGRGLVTALVAAMLAMAFTGCSLLPKATQTTNDPGGAFHLVLPGDWSVSSGPGVITVFADRKTPDPNGPIGKTPWFFIMTAQGESKGSASDELMKLAKQRAHSRGWTQTDFGTPRKSKLGREQAWEMDVSGTDEKNRAFEGKLALARVAGNEVLVFAFTEAGAFSSADYDKLTSSFYWHTPAEQTERAEAK